MRIVYCDICFTNTLSTTSYLLPDVRTDCIYTVNTPTATKQISVNSTKLDIPTIAGVALLPSSTSSCNLLDLNMSTDQMTVRSIDANHFLHYFNALNYIPPKRNLTL
ncbi:hypothetical protein ACHQM5_007689 [Ranunculus cassubicifolius]